MSDETGDQTALIESARVKFKGMSQDSLDDAPGLDERRTYIVKAQCVEHQHKRMKDGEVRLVATMEIDSIYERGKVPIVDEPQPGLFDDDGTTPSGDAVPETDGGEPGADGDQDGEELPEGPEWGDAEANAQQPADHEDSEPTPVGTVIDGLNRVDPSEPDDDDHGRPSFSAIDGGQA